MKRIIATGVAVACAAALFGLSATSEMAPNIEGTYELVRRELPDGSVKTAPDVVGLITFTRERRNFNVCWSDADGRRCSIGSISEYALTDDEYMEKNIYYFINDETEGTGVNYDLSSMSATSPVRKDRGALHFALPLHDEPNVVFTSDGFTATREGEFVDHWKKIK
jgi:hypothetical protein